MNAIRIIERVVSRCMVMISDDGGVALLPNFVIIVGNIAKVSQKCGTIINRPYNVTCYMQRTILTEYVSSTYKSLSISIYKFPHTQSVCLWKKFLFEHFFHRTKLFLITFLQKGEIRWAPANQPTSLTDLGILLPIAAFIGGRLCFIKKECYKLQLTDLDTKTFIITQSGFRL